jgi:hypothetical protein
MDLEELAKQVKRQNEAKHRDFINKINKAPLS